MCIVPPVKNLLAGTTECQLTESGLVRCGWRPELVREGQMTQEDSVQGPSAQTLPGLFEDRQDRSRTPKYFYNISVCS
ncbi:hypothetical protein SRHO_G00323400 [Serrasalmus rhombeus]